MASGKETASHRLAGGGCRGGSGAPARCRPPPFDRRHAALDHQPSRFLVHSVVRFASGPNSSIDRSAVNLPSLPEARSFREAQADRGSASTLAAKMKSLSLKPPILWVQIVTPTLPQARCRSG